MSKNRRRREINAVPIHLLKDDIKLYKFLSALKERIEDLSGLRGVNTDKSEQVITRGDLEKIGIDSNSLETENPSYNFSSLKI